MAYTDAESTRATARTGTASPNQVLFPHVAVPWPRGGGHSGWPRPCLWHGYPNLVVPLAHDAAIGRPRRWHCDSRAYLLRRSQCRTPDSRRRNYGRR